jgi:DNA (cytosine-5)-methyltransferase 1
MKILNLYAGIGGNRKLWTDCEVTAVELDQKIAHCYLQFFPHDNVVVGDAHSYLQEHYSEFDFIWSSPPCPTHGQYRYNVGFRAKGYSAVFPDMKLYEEIIFLKHYFSGLYCVENTKPYYQPLVAPSAVLGRHLVWTNFNIQDKQFKPSDIRSKNAISDFTYGLDISKSKIENKRLSLRNCTDPELGLYVYESIKNARSEQGAEPVQRLTAAGQNTGNTLVLDL